MSNEWPQVEQMRAEILDAERQLAALYSQRGDVIVEMVRAGLTMRQIGALWGVSQVAVMHLVRKRGGSEYIKGGG